MKIIHLNKGYYTKVDDEDFEKLSLYKWTLQSENEMYSKRNHKGKTLYLHREIINCPKGYQVDHRDGDRLNNQRYNLRVCSLLENRRNRARQKNQSNKYIGVSKIKDKYLARFWHEGKTIIIGTFYSEEEAVMARDAKVLEVRKEFAKLNFPPDN